MPHELKADELAQADWMKYLAAEDRAFAEVRDNVTQRLPEGERGEEDERHGQREGCPAGKGGESLHGRR